MKDRNDNPVGFHGLARDVTEQRKVEEENENLKNQLHQVKADAAQLEQVLMNLAVNARDAMPDGGKLILETNLAELDGAYSNDKAGVQPGYYAMISMSDTGDGMDAETVEKILQVLQQQ